MMQRRIAAVFAAIRENVHFRDAVGMGNDVPGLGDARGLRRFQCAAQRTAGLRRKAAERNQWHARRTFLSFVRDADRRLGS